MKILLCYLFLRSLFLNVILRSKKIHTKLQYSIIYYMVIDLFIKNHSIL